MYQAKDGRGFTNKPAMKQHEARTAATPPKAGAQPTPNMHSAPHQGGDMVTCPSCGAQFTPGAEDAQPVQAEDIMG